MRKYELALILHPDLEIDLKRALAKIEDFVKQTGGKILNQDVWGKQKLAYSLKGQQFAIYVFYQLQLPTAQTSELEQSLKLSPEVLRYLIVLQPTAEAVASTPAKTDNKKTKREKKS